MTRSRRLPAALGAGAALLVLAACSGAPTKSGGDTPEGGSRTDVGAVGKDVGRQGPAPAVKGADTGGTITVRLPDDAGPETLDPAGVRSLTGRSIQQALTSRSLTQYVRDGEGQPVLVPDLATDLGTPNEDYTSWTFTIREDATWEDGRPVTADEVAFGICRSLDFRKFPSGPGTRHFRTYLAGVMDYEGPYTGKDPRCERWDGVSVDGQDITLRTVAPFPDMDHWGAFAAMGPAPLGRTSRPPGYGTRPLSNGPYKVDRYEPGVELVLVRNEQWSADSDPGRHQYADRFVFEFDQDQAAVDEIMLSERPESQAAISTSLGAEEYNDVTGPLGSRLVQQQSPCISVLAPDNTRITDINVRKALAYAYPYQDAWIAAGDVPSATRVPANSVMPPVMPGKKDFQVDDEQITYDPVRSKELLAEAGYRFKPYPITLVLDETDPRAAAAQEQVVKGFEEGGFAVKTVRGRRSPRNLGLNPRNEAGKRVNLRATDVCGDWPTAWSLLPPLLSRSGASNTARFVEPSVDQEMADIATLPLDEQPDAWGALDEKIMTEYFPVVPTAFHNELLVFGSRIGNPTGDGATGAPNYKDLYVDR